MADDEDEDITLLLRRMAEGDAEAGERLFRAVHAHLKAQARSLMRGQPAGHSLQASALVNEAYLKLARRRDGGWQDRQHFFCTAARAMRSILVDHARGKARAKRQAPDALDVLADRYEERAIDLLALDESLGRLQAQDPEAAQVVELKFFVGLTTEETAELLGVAPRTVERLWEFARAWLRTRLE